MKIRFEHYETKITAEIPDDSSIDDLLPVIKGLLIALTYPPTWVNNIILSEEYIFTPPEN